MKMDTSMDLANLTFTSVGNMGHESSFLARLIDDCLKEEEDDGEKQNVEEAGETGDQAAAANEEEAALAYLDRVVAENREKDAKNAEADRKEPAAER